MGEFRIPPELLGLQDTVALVTGGGSGVGRGHALGRLGDPCATAGVAVGPPTPPKALAHAVAGK